jgi:choice-of-anchor A domain-containing protein
MTVKLKIQLMLAAAAISSVAASGRARADAISTQQLSLLDQFNLIDLGNLNTSSESEGRVFVGGNESGQLSNVGFNGGLTPSSAGYATLTVDGSINGSANVQSGGISVGGNVNGANLNGSSGTTSQVGGNANNINVNGGALQYGGSRSGGNLNGGATAQHVTGLTPGIAAGTFQTLSNLTGTLDGLTGNSSVTVANNTATFNAVANAQGQAIFHIGSSVFSNGQFQFNLNGATSVIIDVDGATSLTSDANFLGGAAQNLAHDLIWNFNDISSLNIGAEFGGTILAPDAAVSNTASIDGSLLAGSFSQSGELHSYDYQGTLPDGGTPSPVPEPSTIALFGTGLLGLVAIAKRRARARRAG